MIQSTAPVLHVSDFPRARAFYVDDLGFEVVTEAGDPPRFAILRRDGAQLMLDGWHGADAPHPAWRAYVWTDDLPTLEAEFLSAGVEIKGPRTQSYGMTEIEVTDPDGNVICFGQDA